MSIQYLNFRSLSQLELAMQELAKRTPVSVDLIVGVPRSGLLAASILALQLNVELTDVSGYLTGRTLGSGVRPRRSGGLAPGEETRTLLVDDSVLAGVEITKIKKRLQQAGMLEGVMTAAPFVSSRGKHMVDMYAEVVEPPRAFAWNILHLPGHLKRACVDIDGVLCLDPLPEDNDDGPNYVRFLESAHPLFLPSTPVKAVVTSRLERYRAKTEEWLAAHDVRYEKLMMLDSIDAATRRAEGLHGKFKASAYTASGADLFIESDHVQALEIARLSGRQVFAVDRREMLYPSVRSAIEHSPADVVQSAFRIPPVQTLYWTTRRFAKRAIRRPT